MNSLITSLFNRNLLFFTISIRHIIDITKLPPMSYWCQEPQKPDGKSLLQLITAIKHLSWEAVEDRVTNFPSEASEADEFGLTAIHHAIRKRHCAVPIPIIRALISAHPPSLELSDDQTGCNALHIACTNSNSNDKTTSTNEIVTMILDANPNGAKQLCKEGRIPLHRAKNLDIATKLIEVYPEGLGIISKTHKYLPLHDACSDNIVPPDVVQLLIEHGRKQRVGIECSSGSGNYCGGVLVEDIYGDIALKILFRRIMFSSKVKSTGNGLVIDEDSPVWVKLCIVAKATYLALRNFPNGWASRPTPLVHAIIECGGHPKIVQHALKLHPEEIVQRDDEGRAPLSIAAGKVNSLPEIFELLLDSNGCGNSNAGASMSDANGRLPLHLAVESGRTLNNGVALIASAAPLALRTRDVETRMYPFMLAAIPTFGWDNSSIDTIFGLLRDTPDVMQTFCTEDDD